MPKKRGSTKKRTVKNKTPKTKFHTDNKVEKVLVENFVSLQKVMTNLSTKFDNLANQISKLLELFEISAKTLAEKDFNLEKGSEGEKEITNKIDNLLEQNKIIARGLTLLHEPSHEKEHYLPPLNRPMQIAPPQIPKSQPRLQQNVKMTGYQKSTPIKDSSDFLSEEAPKRRELPRKS